MAGPQLAPFYLQRCPLHSCQVDSIEKCASKKSAACGLRNPYPVSMWCNSVTPCIIRAWGKNNQCHIFRQIELLVAIHYLMQGPSNHRTFESGKKSVSPGEKQLKHRMRCEEWS